MVIFVLLCAFGATEEQALIVNRSLTMAALAQERMKMHRPLPPRLNRRQCRQERRDDPLCLHRLLVAGLVRLCHCLSSLARSP
jgi:hypothetical protein